MPAAELSPWLNERPGQTGQCSIGCLKPDLRAAAPNDHSWTLQAARVAELDNVGWSSPDARLRPSAERRRLPGCGGSRIPMGRS